MNPIEIISDVIGDDESAEAVIAALENQGWYFVQSQHEEED